MLAKRALPASMIFQHQLEANSAATLRAIEMATAPELSDKARAYWLGRVDWYARNAAHYGAAILRQRGQY